jgi:putative toxin-antitoxin system antitoxin component (TIGR02293 family)
MAKHPAKSSVTGRLRKSRPRMYEQPEETVDKVAENGITLEEAIMENRILAAASKNAESGLTTYQKIALIDEGISKTDLEKFKERAGWDYNQLSDILGVARAKLIAKKGNERFDKQVSEKIVSLADLYSYGYEVFEDEDRFNRWIFSSIHALGGLAPFDYLDTHYGREEIKNLIGRIDYGVYS